MFIEKRIEEVCVDLIKVKQLSAPLQPEPWRECFLKGATVHLEKENLTSEAKERMYLRTNSMNAVKIKENEHY
jgi:hypothetical protein